MGMFELRGRRRWLVLSVLAAGFVLAFAAAGIAIAGKPWSPLARPIPIQVTAMPIDFDRDHPGRKDFGKLIFRRGLNLFASSHHFGGYSALAIDPSGRKILAVSDAGTWLRADLDYDGRYLKGLGNAAIGPLLGKDGKPLSRFSRRDAEALALKNGNVEEGEAYIAFEVDHRIERYPFDRTRFGPPDGAVSLPDDSLMGNAGIEALAVLKAGPSRGSLLAFSQERRDRTNALQGWLIGGPKPGLLTVKDIGNFTITDMTALPDGDIALLERRFTFTEGVQIRIRRLAASDIRPGAALQGEVLLQVRDNFNIDNMEAIAAHRAADGQTILTVMSDDNFMSIQRTLLLQFALKEAGGEVLGGASPKRPGLPEPAPSSARASDALP